MSTTEKAKNIKKYLDSIRETGYDLNGVKWQSEVDYIEHIIKTIEYASLDIPCTKDQSATLKRWQQGCRQ